MQKTSFVIAIAIGFLNSSIVFADKSPKCPGEEGYYYVNYKKSKNPEAGGFVSHLSDVEDDRDVFIAKTAAVCGSSSVRDSVRIYGNAVIVDSEISEKARIYGDAKVSSNSRVYGNAKIFENAEISESQIYEDAVIRGSASVYKGKVLGKATVTNNARVSGNSEISGDATLNGWFKAYSQKISTGTHSAPEFTAEELAAKERLRQEKLASDAKAKQLEAERLAELAKRKQTIESTRADLDSFLKKKLVISGPFATNSETVETTASSDPCKVTFFDDANSSVGRKTFNFRTTLQIKRGVYTSKPLSQYPSNFANAFEKNYPLRKSKYHFEESFLDKVFPTAAVPMIVISTQSIQEVGTVGKTGEKNFVFSEVAQHLLFPAADLRDDFLDLLNNLSQSCY